MGSMRVYCKKQIQVASMNLRQSQMFKIGNAGVAAVKYRVSSAIGPNDGPAKPLTRRYAIRKTMAGHGNRRNLTYSGDMLRNFGVRTVSEKEAKASLTTRKDRIKAWINEKIESWCTFSNKNQETVRATAQTVVNEQSKRMVFQRLLGGRNV